MHNDPLPRRLALDIEQATALDGPANALAEGLNEAIPEQARSVLRGDPIGHPLHPPLTDVPIGAWTSSVLLDWIGGASSHRAADSLLAVGILAYLPAAATGASDWSEKTAPGPMRRVGLAHALANITALTLFTVSLASRLRGRRWRGRMLSLAGSGALGAGAYLGGHLVSVGAVGVEPQQPLSPDPIPAP
ncbi:MAG: DUF2231 domain-containing protein [Solirubrobacteraceae bacterium]